MGSKRPYGGYATEVTTKARRAQASPQELARFGKLKRKKRRKRKKREQ